MTCRTMLEISQPCKHLCSLEICWRFSQICYLMFPFLTLLEMCFFIGICFFGGQCSCVSMAYFIQFKEDEILIISLSLSLILLSFTPSIIFVVMCGISLVMSQPCKYLRYVGGFPQICLSSKYRARSNSTQTQGGGGSAVDYLPLKIRLNKNHVTST